jgi:hypothetical protein
VHRRYNDSALDGFSRRQTDENLFPIVGDAEQKCSVVWPKLKSATGTAGTKMSVTTATDETGAKITTTVMTITNIKIDPPSSVMKKIAAVRDGRVPMCDDFDHMSDDALNAICIEGKSNTEKLVEQLFKPT